MLHAMVSARTVRPVAAPAVGLSVGARCVRVGQRVTVRGSGFGAGLPYDLSVDGVDFGQSLVGSDGSFATSLVPGGLAAGQPQIIDTLTASDGSLSRSTEVTVTRGTGALFSAGTGGSPRRAVRFKIWDFAPSGPQVPIYLHYVAPGGRVSPATVALGLTHGECGVVVTGRRPLFGFSPTAGTWTLQFDTSRRWSAAPAGNVARLSVSVGG